MREHNLRDEARKAFSQLGPQEASRVAAVIAELMDEGVPLVKPGDLSVHQGVWVMGRTVPETDLVVCYVPAGLSFFVVNIVRRTP